MSVCVIQSLFWRVGLLCELLFAAIHAQQGVTPRMPLNEQIHHQTDEQRNNDPYAALFAAFVALTAVQRIRSIEPLALCSCHVG